MARKNEAFAARAKEAAALSQPRTHYLLPQLASRILSGSGDVPVNAYAMMDG